MTTVKSDDSSLKRAFCTLDLSTLISSYLTALDFQSMTLACRGFRNLHARNPIIVHGEKSHASNIPSSQLPSVGQWFHSQVSDFINTRVVNEQLSFRTDTKAVVRAAIGRYSLTHRDALPFKALPGSLKTITLRTESAELDDPFIRCTIMVGLMFNYVIM